MHAITRTYTGKGAKELAKLLVERKGEVERLIGDVPGLISYELVETKDGCFSITVCQDKAGADRSLAVAKDWLKANAGQLGLGAPTVAEGKVAIHLGAKKPAVA